MISAEKVKELREKSGAGMMDCKRALAAVGGQIDQAIDFLRKEGVVKAARKAGRPTLEGLVTVASSLDRLSHAIVEVNCETDFVARTGPFQSFLSLVAEQVLLKQPTNLEGFLKEPLSELILRLGENMSIRRTHAIRCEKGEVCGSYLHAGSKIGVLVRLKDLPEGCDLLARDVAMHVAAMAPRYIDRNAVPQAVIDREREIARSSPELTGKPQNIIDKIIEGKSGRFFSEVCLLGQPFIKDPTGKKTVGESLRETGKGATVVEMVRYQVGEEIA